MFPPAYFGIESVAACDYPLESDVRFGVDYADGTMTGTLVISIMPSFPNQISAIIAVYDESGELENGVKVYHRLVIPPASVAVYDNAIKMNTSVNGIIIIDNLFKGGIYEFWRGRSSRVRKRIPIDGVLGVTPPSAFTAVPIGQNVQLNWGASSVTELFFLTPILGNDSLDPCIT